MTSPTPAATSAATPHTGASNPTHRPRYHFLPAANWMNDPNGMIYWQGVYHMFYQYNPTGAFWAPPYWGHATSTDLLHWQDEPIALSPEPGSYDEQGCWSGCAVDDGGVPTIIYTGVSQGRQRPCLATSHDGLRSWQKYAGNPIIPTPPDIDLLGAGAVVDFRDHAIWREDGVWHMIIGSGLRGVGGAVLLYRSADLRSWEYLHPLCVGNLAQGAPVSTGVMWECPQLLAAGDRHALVVSAYGDGIRYTLAMTGTYAQQRFTPQLIHRLDYGDDYFYAPQALIDGQGRTLMWGWLTEGRTTEAQQADGWSGVMSLPRVVALGQGGALCLAPAPELEALRGERLQLGPQPIGASATLASVRGDCLEIHARIDPGDADRCGVAVRCSDDGAERTRILFDRAAGQIGIDATQASASSSANNDARSGPLALAPGELLDLRIFVDRSVIEVFVNGRACCTGRVYPTRPDSLGIQLFAEGGEAALAELQAWEMRSIWGAPAAER